MKRFVWSIVAILALALLPQGVWAQTCSFDDGGTSGPPGNVLVWERWNCGSDFTAAYFGCTGRRNNMVAAGADHADFMMFEQPDGSWRCAVDGLFLEDDEDEQLAVVVPLVAGVGVGWNAGCQQLAANWWLCDDLPSAGAICTNVIATAPIGTQCIIKTQPNGQMRSVHALIPQE